MDDVHLPYANRSREIVPFPTEGTSRCGEIFVTNNADKWTFFCSFCEKSTNDIGVFICHIKLDHLSSQDFQQTNRIIQTELQKTINASVASFRQSNQQQAESNLIKEEAIYSRVPKIVDIYEINENKGSKNVISNKDPILTSHSQKFFTIESKDEDVKQEFHSVKENKKIIQVRNNEKYKNNINKSNNENIYMDDYEDINGVDGTSILSPNDDDNTNENASDLECNNEKANGSKSRIEIRKYIGHECEYCDLNFKFRSTLDDHLKKDHNLKPNEMPLKCKQCKKFFRSVAGLKNHLKAHDEKHHIKCPICKAKHKQNYFVTHVLTHESDTCFPCQVCGKIYTSNEERIKHWKTHANDMPFSCDFCYRRFRKQQYLTHHLKSHFQYQCQFCPAQFNAVESQKPPYACTTCENLPAIRKRVPHQRMLANKYHLSETGEDC